MLVMELIAIAVIRKISALIQDPGVCTGMKEASRAFEIQTSNFKVSPVPPSVYPPDITAGNPGLAPMTPCGHGGVDP